MSVSHRRLALTVVIAILVSFSASVSSAAVMSYEATEAVADAFAKWSGGHAFWLKNLFTSGSEPEALKKYVFVGNPTFLVDDQGTGYIGDDTIMFTGSIVSLGDSSRTFDFEVEFDRIADDEPTPDGSPKRDLIDEAYIEFGPDPGIDPSLWSLWLLDSGSLTGTGALAGAEIALHHATSGSELDPAFGLGEGASGKNIDEGFSGWLEWQRIRNVADRKRYLRWDGVGDININIFRKLPVPATAPLVGLGLLGVALLRRRGSKSR